MNTKHLVLILLSIIFLTSCIKNRKDEFTKYELPDIGSIYVHNSFELLSGQDRTYSLTKHSSLDVPENIIVFRSKETVPYAVYLTIKTLIGQKGDFLTLGSRFFSSKEEIEEINKLAYPQLIEANKIATGMHGIEIEVKEWSGVSQIKLNRQPAIFISYIKSTIGMPDIKIDKYEIHNNDRVHFIMATYIKEEETIWEPLFKEILNSLEIVKI